MIYVHKVGQVIKLNIVVKMPSKLLYIIQVKGSPWYLSFCTFLQPGWDKNLTDALDIKSVANEYVAGNEHWLTLFGKFQ